MRALLSVWDKTGLEAFARGLVALEHELISSGNTSRFLADKGIPHTEVSTVTGAPEILGGRVKTLHPKIHGGILADRAQPQHHADLAAQRIEPIDLVVCNLYPFRDHPGIETIDIGGPAMVRAAAKNHDHVGVVVDPAEYGPVLDELRREGSLGADTRRRLARAAFAHTAAYDAAIVSWLDLGASGPPSEEHGAAGDLLPPTIHLALERTEDKLRYGENPHQHGARYRAIGQRSWWDEVEQLSGLTLSYLNVYDTEAAWHLVHDLTPPSAAGAACAIIKHANPCGAAVAADAATAYVQALAADEKSAFGGIVAVDSGVTEEVADAIAGGPQADVVIAPSFAPGAVDKLIARRKATRLLRAPAPLSERLHFRQIDGGFLVQEPHHFASSRDDWRVVTRRQPTEDEWRDAEMAWRLGGYVKSNSIVLVARGQAVGIGAGQQSRVDAAEIAAKKAAGRAEGGACASDAFYPFRDGIDAAASAGVAAVIQPGGALHDDEIIAAADELGLAMVFTGERHFFH
ncbi:MAG: bifunctional phosphoribosylaminoimidazolecarboxamide formyltransferase/IMP cyclohydrolase [Actinomycetota bacterium]|nr:bifunctional phosphoribosylaminoimidazolecarboxamide formyltransferase/IMP cyclohydrolase [Actinomycetota bacterium]